MDTDAARRARQKSIKADMAEAYDDDEACPPEWVELIARCRTERADVLASIERATQAFVEEPDIRRALADRERFDTKMRDRIVRLNDAIARLNLLAPHSRFTRSPVDADEVLRPLYRASRLSGRSAG